MSRAIKQADIFIHHEILIHFIPGIDDHSSILHQAVLTHQGIIKIKKNNYAIVQHFFDKFDNLLISKGICTPTNTES